MTRFVRIGSALALLLLTTPGARLLAATAPPAHQAKPPVPATPSTSGSVTLGPQPPAATPPLPAPIHRNLGGPGDFALREKLIGRMQHDEDLAQAHVDVILVNGGAVFSGSIQTWTLKRRLLALAGTQRGIYNVVDQMTIPRGNVGDGEISRAIGSILADYKEALGLRDLQVDTEDGVATLRGPVTNFASRVRAEEAAGTVLGLQRIVNRLVPDSVTKGGPDDVSVRRAVVAYLKDFRDFPYPGEIEVNVQNGRVTLTGSLPMYLARQQAAAMAALVGGVRQVENQIRVDPSIQGAFTSVQERP